MPKTVLMQRWRCALCDRLHRSPTAAENCEKRCMARLSRGEGSVPPLTIKRVEEAESMLRVGAVFRVKMWGFLGGGVACQNSVVIVDPSLLPYSTPTYVNRRGRHPEFQYFGEGSVLLAAFTKYRFELAWCPEAEMVQLLMLGQIVKIDNSLILEKMQEYFRGMDARWEEGLIGRKIGLEILDSIGLKEKFDTPRPKEIPIGATTNSLERANKYYDDGLNQEWTEEIANLTVNPDKDSVLGKINQLSKKMHKKLCKKNGKTPKKEEEADVTVGIDWGEDVGKGLVLSTE